MPSDAKDKKKRKVKIITCIRCGKTAQYGGPGPICNSCHVKEYKQRTGYKGPIRKCVECGNITNMWAHGLCRSCYNREYGKKNRESLTQKQHERRLNDPEKFREWNRKWKAANPDKVKESQRKHYYKDVETSRRKSREYGRNHREEINAKHRKGYFTKEQIIIPLEFRIQQIPDLKRKLVEEFLNTVYKDRSETTKKIFVKNVNKLVDFEKSLGNASYLAAWNTMPLEVIDRFQIENGVLKDSVRIFFKWLHKRKKVIKDLSVAIPTETAKRRVNAVSSSRLNELVKKWYAEEGELIECIVGLLVVFYILTGHQMRYIKDSDVYDGILFLDGREIKLDEKIIELIERYRKWKKEFYGEDSPDFLFVNSESYYRKIPVSVTYFTKMFRRFNVGLTVSELRKAMIVFHKDKTGLDPFALGKIAGITPRAASIYYND